MPRPDVTPLLRKLDGGDSDDRIAAAAELERLRRRDEPVIAALARALDDTDPRVVVAATRALRRSVGAWQTEQIVHARRRPIVVTARLAQQVAAANGKPLDHPPAPRTSAPHPAAADPPRRQRGRRRRGGVRAAQRRRKALAALRKYLIRGERAARRGLAALGRRLHLPLTEDSLDGLVGAVLYVLLAVAAAALGHLNAWFIAGAFDAPAAGVLGALATAVTAGGLIVFSLVRTLDRVRGLWPFIAGVVLLGLFVAFTIAGALAALGRQGVHVPASH
jgi:hypothetical protein